MFRPLGLMLVTLATLGSSLAQAPQAGTLTVTGSGTVYGQPDRALLEIGVNLSDETLSVALENANSAIRDISEALREAGVAEDDIRTSYFNIWQEQPYSPEGPAGTPIYRVNHILSVTVRDTGEVGELLDAAIDAGANTVNGVQYTLADPETLAGEAREAAFANARAKAEQLAELAGRELGPVLALSDGSGFLPVAPVAAEGMAMRGDMGSSVPVTGGQLAVSASVTVQFGLGGGQIRPRQP